MSFIEMLKFFLGFIGMMAIIGGCLLLVGYIGKRDAKRKTERENEDKKDQLK